MSKKDVFKQMRDELNDRRDRKCVKCGKQLLVECGDTCTDCLTEWRLLVDYPQGMMDPCEIQYRFVKFVSGRETVREPMRCGFTSGHNELRKILTKQLEALDKPALREIKTTKLVELKS